MALLKLESINIKSFNLGEADKLVTLFTKEQGKVRAVAKGARRMRSRFGGRLELFVHNNILLVEGKSLDQLSQAETIATYLKIREDMDLFSTASYLCWIVDKATEEKQPNAPLFGLLQKCLELLADGEEFATIRHSFQKKFLEIEGIMPQISEDLNDRMFEKHFGDYTSVSSFMGMKNDGQKNK